MPEGTKGVTGVMVEKSGDLQLIDQDEVVDCFGSVALTRQTASIPGNIISE